MQAIIGEWENERIDMNIPDRTPLYNLSAVLRETGLKADLVRAWERRYNLPVPQRSNGGHRLYSAYDIAVLKWLKAKQAEGLSISNAVELWNSILKDGKDPLSLFTKNMDRNLESIDPNTDSLETLRQRWLEACMHFNNTDADEALTRAFSLYQVEAVCISVLQKGLSEIGSGWYANKVSVQQEHFTSALANRRLDTLMSLTPLPTQSQTVLVGCPAGEWHTFPVQLLELFLRRRGYKVVNLGADIPADRVVTTIFSINPQLVVMSAQTLVSAASLGDVFSTLRTSGTLLAYGGQIFNRVPAIRNAIPGYFLGEVIEESINEIETLLRNPAIQSTAVVRSGKYLQLIQRFQEKRVILELDLVQSFTKDALPSGFLNIANTFLGNGLVAALNLGDLAYIYPDLEWIGNMLTARELPFTLLLLYLNTYREMLKTHLGQEGLPITNMIDTFISENNTARK